MSEIILIWPSSIPATEYNQTFLQGMLNRMANSFSKYGPMHEAKDINHLKSSETRVDRYKADGNIEWLMDAANELMIEFTIPSHPNAHMRSTSSAESPGLPTIDGEVLKRR